MAKNFSGFGFASPVSEYQYTKDAKADPRSQESSAWTKYKAGLFNPVGSGARSQGAVGGATQVGGQAIQTMAQPVAHPVQTLQGTAGAMRHPIQTARGMAQKYQNDVEQGGQALALENAAGQIIGTAEGGRATGGLIDEVAPVAARVVSKGAQRVAKVTPKRVLGGDEGLIATKTRDVATKLAQEQTEARVRIAETQRSEVASTLTKNERQYKTSLKQISDNAHKSADAEEDALRDKLGKYEADPEHMIDAVAEASSGFETPEAKPPLFSRIETAVNRKHITYDNLSSLRSEIGKELNKGTLPGNTYHIYRDILEPAISKEMERIASNHGLSGEAAHARTAWKDWASTFRDRGAPGRNVIKSPEAHGLFRAYRGKDVSGIEALRKFGPEASNLADKIQADLDIAERGGYTPTAYGKIAAPKMKVKVEPVSPEEVTPEVKISRQDIVGAKTKALREAVQKMRQGKSPIVSSIVIFDVIRNAMRGNVHGVAVDLAARGIYGAGRAALPTLLERPSIIRLLTEPTAADIRFIPEGMRGNLQELASAAKSNGIKVSPKLTKALGMSVSTSGALSVGGPRSRSLRELVDDARGWYNPKTGITTESPTSTTNQVNHDDQGGTFTDNSSQQDTNE
jgi:hypothetical protein